MKSKPPSASPHNLESEAHVLGSILLDPKALSRVTPILGTNPTAFFKASHQYIYAAMLRLTEKNTPIDLETLAVELHRVDQLLPVGSTKTLYLMQESVPSAANVEYYAQEVHQQALRRRVIDVGNSMLISAGTASTDLSDIIYQSQKAILDLSSKHGRRLWIDAPEIVEMTIASIENPDFGWSTGIHDLDNLMGGMRRTYLYILGARPGMGKTAFALHIARQALEGDKPRRVLIFSMEMAAEDIMKRMASAATLVPYRKIDLNKMDATQRTMFDDAMDYYSTTRLAIFDRPSPTIAEMQQQVQSVGMKYGGLDLVVVDYLQLMGSYDPGVNRVQEISQLSRFLKDLAMSEDCPVLAVSQLNRVLEGSTNKRPALSHLRESGQIEQDADVVILMYRDEYYEMQRRGQVRREYNPSCELNVAKNRRGRVDTVYCEFYPETMSFVEQASRFDLA